MTRLATSISSLLVLVGCGLSQQELRRAEGCDVRPDSSGIRIDGVNDFARSETFEIGSGRALAIHTAYVSWDECHAYFGFQGPALAAGSCAGAGCGGHDRGASPFRYLTLYVNTDPLGDDGVLAPYDYGPPRPRLPFEAEYLLEVRTDGRPRSETDSTYVGNVQLYHARSEWQAGLMESWRPQQTDRLDVAADPSTGYLEVAIERALLGDPCAIEVAAWVVDREADANAGFWPAPLPQPSARSGTERGEPSNEFVLADSLTLNYYGFELGPDAEPNTTANLNRTNYQRVGECAYGTRYDQ